MCAKLNVSKRLRLRAVLVAVLAASALNSVLGIGVLVLYAAMVLVCLAVGVFTVIPEHRQ